MDRQNRAGRVSRGADRNRPHPRRPGQDGPASHEQQQEHHADDRAHEPAEVGGHPPAQCGAGGGRGHRDGDRRERVVSLGGANERGQQRRRRRARPHHLAPLFGRSSIGNEQEIRFRFPEAQHPLHPLEEKV